MGDLESGLEGMIPGTQEIRSKIGHVCLWGTVFYGNGIFMTISPGERTNYLAIRLAGDPNYSLPPSQSKK
jgi:hypothetical protein